MVSNSIDQNNGHWIRSGSLIVDLPGMQKGLQEPEKYRQEIWDYIQYRESLVMWPSTNEKIKGNTREKN
jgi:predicted GTPase